MIKEAIILLFFDYSLHPTLFCFSVRWTSQWLDIHILYKVFLLIIRVHLAPWTTTMPLLTIFPMPSLTSQFCDDQLVLLNPFTFFNPATQRPSPLATISLFSVPISLFLFRLFICLFCSLDSSYKWNHMVLVCLWLTYFTEHNTLWVYPCCWKW